MVVTNLDVFLTNFFGINLGNILNACIVDPRVKFVVIMLLSKTGRKRENMREGLQRSRRICCDYSYSGVLSSLRLDLHLCTSIIF